MRHMRNQEIGENKKKKKDVAIDKLIEHYRKEYE